MPAFVAAFVAGEPGAANTLSVCFSRMDRIWKRHQRIFFFGGHIIRVMKRMNTLSGKLTNYRYGLYGKWLKSFMLCGITGWCLEILFTSVESILHQDWRLMGKTSLIMFPIYGLGVFLGPICRRIDQWLDEGLWNGGRIPQGELLLRHGMIDMVLIFTAEYLFGLWLGRMGICPWDYRGMPTNIHGLIRLDFAPLWFLTGLILEKVTKNQQKNEPLIL